MTKKAVKIDLILYQVFIRKKFDFFTVAELRDFYMEESALYNDSDRNIVRTWLYGQLKRLMNHRFVVKLSEQSFDRPIYVKTDLFYYAKFNVDGKILDPIIDVENGVGSRENENIISDLRSRAKQHRVDLMTSLAEAEEYMSMIKSYPELSPVLNEQYYISRVNSTKLLGKLKAAEIVLDKWLNHEA